MIPLQKNDHLYRSGTGDSFKINFRRTLDTYGTVHEEYSNSCKEVYELSTGTFHLMYSGGIDSEYILNTFLSLGIPVKPVIIKLLPHYNDHDTKWAFDFCEAKNLSPIIIDIDFDKFVNTGKLFDYGAKYKTSAYYYCPLMHAIGQLSGTVIVGLGESHLVKNTENNKWYNSWDEYEYSVVNFFHENNITGTCQFGSWSEGQFFSYASDPILTELSLNKIVGKLGSNSSKHHIYNRNAVQPLQVRPKYHGYEIIEQSEIFKHPSFTDIKTVNKQNDGVYQLEYFEFLDIYKSIQVGTDV